MTPFYRIKATGETTGGLISAWEAATVGEKEDALLERSEPPPMGVSSGVSGGSIAEAIESVPLSLVFPPGTPSWPPPGARANTPRGTFSSALSAIIRVVLLIPSNVANALLQ